MSPLIAGEEKYENSISGTIKIVSSNDNQVVAAVSYDSLLIWTGFILILEGYCYHISYYKSQTKRMQWSIRLAIHV